MKILYVTSRFPYPLEKGDKLRAYNQIKNLSRHHEIFLFSLSDTKVRDDKINHLKQFCKKVEVYNFSRFARFMNLLRATFTGMPWQVGYFYSPHAQKKFNKFISVNHPHHIFCQLIRTSEYAKEHQHILKTLDYMDAFSKGIERRMTKVPFYMEPLYRMEYARLLKYEKDIFNYFNNKIVISVQDRDLIPHDERNKIAVISNGVDNAYFKPMDRKKEFDIIYSGNMSYPPNIEGSKYLVNSILPIVLKDKPDIKILISGANPSPAVRALSSKNVTISGWVDDIRENYARSKMLVAPMYMSIGLQNKLLEAMAMQVPCITSTLANNALGAKNGESIMVADSAEEYAKQIILFLTDEKKAKEIGIKGQQFVSENYNWDKENSTLEMILKSTVNE